MLNYRKEVLLMLKKFCPCCNNVLINYNESYCERCSQKKKENRKDYFKTYNENRDEIYDFYSSKEWRTIREVIKVCLNAWHRHTFFIDKILKNDPLQSSFRTVYI